MTLSDLIARLEAASGPDRALDAEIARMFGKTTASGIPSCAGFLGIGAFTGSIDAAVALAERVFHGTEIEISNLYGVARAAINLNLSDGPSYGSSECGSIPIALLIATLKAKEASDVPPR